VTLSGTAPKTATVSITTTAASQLLPLAAPSRNGPSLPSGTIFWIVGVFLAASIAVSLKFVRIPRRRFAFSFTTACSVITLVAASLIAGCGSGSGSDSGGGGGTATPAGTYIVIVTATSQSRVITQTTKLTLVVQ